MFDNEGRAMKSLITTVSLLLFSGVALAALTGSSSATGKTKTQACSTAKTMAGIEIQKNREFENSGPRRFTVEVREEIGPCECEMHDEAKLVGTAWWECSATWKLELKGK